MQLFKRFAVSGIIICLSWTLIYMCYWNQSRHLETHQLHVADEIKLGEYLIPFTTHTSVFNVPKNLRREHDSNETIKNFKKKLQFNNILPFQAFIKRLLLEIENPLSRDRKRNHYIFKNFQKAKTKFSYKDVTIASQTTANHFVDLQVLLEYWDGPISLALFLYHGQEEASIKTLAHMVLCNEKFRDQVSLHLVFPIMHPPRFFSFAQTIWNQTFSCEEEISSFFTKKRVNYDMSVSYPINVLRNVALNNTYTEYVMNLDIDIIPNKSFRKDFLQNILNRTSGWHINTTKHYRDNNAKEIMILPCFEVVKGFKQIKDKCDVMRLLHKKWIIPCRIHFFPQAHWPTDFDQWSHLKCDETLDKAYAIKYSNYFEPYYIGRKKHLPVFYEDFESYGYNRNTQMCEVNVTGYEMYVLNSAFVLHRGVKKASALTKDRMKEGQRNSHVAKYFRQYLKKKYSFPNSKMNENFTYCNY